MFLLYPHRHLRFGPGTGILFPWPWHGSKEDDRAFKEVHRTVSQRSKRQITKRIIGSYDSRIIRWYCTIRFRIINLRMLDDIEQYMPRRGTILDLGCGFGLFSHYFALCSRRRKMLSLDLNARRIDLARGAAERLGTTEQTNFQPMNVLDYPFDSKVSGIIMLDLVHHLPKGSAERILQHCHDILEEGGVLLIKDVEAAPFWKMAFTWLLDKAMDFRTPVNYYHREKLIAYLRRIGFTVYSHHMLDVLPYPHVFFICWKKEKGTGTRLRIASARQVGKQGTVE